ncbi:hypothetical protein FEM48_Zijuj04G0022800 [Ziziphus jujuba var. spinosa]|uniref:Gnk2-homologous domain-containing protein n=1 Tax=Ziziphus jujuba var. spinosa TaxID=714518 RepID=A0A978VH96_ZIZJJ|nr:hypothetical protein FEM48_Zijuj04G0022800 [Ziziphus jujuba var. spinosa]
MAASVLFIFFIVILCLVDSSRAEPRTELMARSCRQTHVLNPTNYEDNYYRMVADMEEDMARNLFAFREKGERPDRLYVFSQCMGDLSSDDCRQCFNAITDVLPGCFPATGGRVFFDGCFIRAENYSFFRDAIEPDDLRRCSASVDDRPLFGATARKVVNDLARMAPENNGFAVAYQRSPPDFFVFAMANCWKTIGPDLCSACLANAAQGCSSCLPSTEARVFNSGCVLRYSDYDFGNKPDYDHKSSLSRESILRYTSYVVGGLAVSALMIIIGFYVGKTAYRRINRQSQSNIGTEIDLSVLKRSISFLQFSYSTLEKATNSFNEAFKLGQGGYGEVFKGTLADGREIAIKRLFASGKGRAAEAWNHFQTNSVSEIVDKSIEIEDIEEAIRIVQIGLLCTQVSPSKRPDMTVVNQMLNDKNIELPAPLRPPFADEHMELYSLLGSGRRQFSSTFDTCKSHHEIFEHDPV